ncbi:hypothetical protein RSAG8_13626, partial [Rhizoctonia solani AG-8 WAC10335]
MHRATHPNLFPQLNYYRFFLVLSNVPQGSERIPGKAGYLRLGPGREEMTGYNRFLLLCIDDDRNSHITIMKS